MHYSTKGRWRRFVAAGMTLALIGGACVGGGISGTSFIAGAITALGSITLRGITFDTDSAIITVEGNLATLSDLRVGMTVAVRGHVNSDGVTGVADRVAFENVLKGPVEGVNVGAGTLSALSQLIITTPATVFDSTSLATLMPGEMIEVSGVLDSDGSVRATRVGLQQGVPEIEVQGFVTNIDTVAMTFSLGVLTVDYTSALLENLPPGGLANGLLVEAETDTAPVADLMDATGVEVFAPDLMAEGGDSIGVEGFVTSIVSATDFTINGIHMVRTSNATLYEGGDAADVVLNARVDVEGTFGPGGVLLADEVEFVP